MSIKKLIERAKGLGLPIAENQFEGTEEDPVPPLPYLVYLVSHERSRGADTINNLVEQDFDLELYTAQDDEERKSLAERIENEVFFDVEHEMFLEQIPNEECWQTAYEVKGLLTKKRGAGRA